jgi:hypothetical protein
MKFNAVQSLSTGEYRGTEGEAYNPSNYYAPEVLYGGPAFGRRMPTQEAWQYFSTSLMDSTDNLWQFDGNSDPKPEKYARRKLRNEREVWSSAAG